MLPWTEEIRIENVSNDTLFFGAPLILIERHPNDDPNFTHEIDVWFVVCLSIILVVRPVAGLVGPFGVVKAPSAIPDLDDGEKLAVHTIKHNFNKFATLNIRISVGFDDNVQLFEETLKTV